MVTIAVAGISGRFGRCVVLELLKKTNVSVRGLVRDKSKVSSAISNSPAVGLIEGDASDPETLRKLVQGGDNKFMVDGQKLLIDAAEAAGVPRYVASDYTLDYTKLEYGELPAKDPMKEVHEYLKGKKIRGVHSLVGAFVDTFWASWFRIWNPEDVSLSFYGTGNETWEFTSYENAAEFVTSLALDEKAIGFQKFLGDIISVNQIAQTFEEVYGRKLQLRTLGSLDDLKQQMKSEQEQNPEDFMS